MLIQGMMSLTVLWSARTASAGEFTGEAVSLQVQAVAVGDFDCSGVTDQAVVSRTPLGNLVIDLAVDVKDPSKEMASIDKEMTVEVTDLNGDKCSDLAVDVAGRAIGLTAADFESFGVKDGGGDSLPDASVYFACTDDPANRPDDPVFGGFECREVNECVYYGQVTTIECGPGIQCPIPLCTKWRWVCDPRWF